MPEPNALAASSLQFPTARRFFVRHRVTISLLLFVALLVEDIVFGTLPRHGWLSRASWQGYLGLAFVLAGVGIRSWAAGILRKGLDLTVVGPYSLCRNPLYLGSFAAMFGFCLLIGYAHDFLVVCGPIAAIYYFTVLNEERRLQDQYPARWPEYAARTPRFLPLKPQGYVAGRWSAAQWMKSREYQGLIAMLAGVLALEAWRLLG